MRNAADTIPALFETGESEELPTRKGMWKIYRQHDYPEAEYVRSEKIKTELYDILGVVCSLYCRLE